ncbi:helix-turn-helix transcriptional regulator [Streptomyces sp. NPDC047000]|uniref:helix-turn-helix transcriptional regulator n=1 Tax=Streptomyces sp. NPDC047000 TaxID=3155474 RepID=UPI0033D6F8BC
MGTSILIELANDMVTTRKEVGLTLKNIADTTHYSVSALSQATSGKSIPTTGIIKAYAEALGIDPKHWYDMRDQAVKERGGKGRKNTPKNDNRPPGSSRRPASPAPSLANVSAFKARAAMAQVVGVGGGKLSRDSDLTESESKNPEPPGNVAVATMHKLVLDAFEQAPSQLHGHPVANVLSLCTIPADLLEVLRDTRERSGLSFRACSAALRSKGVDISATTLQRLLNGVDLPPVDLLHALLTTCRVQPEEIRYWLYHRARLELASARAAQRGVPVEHLGRARRKRSDKVLSYKVARPTLFSPALPVLLSLIVFVVEVWTKG